MVTGQTRLYLDTVLYAVFGALFGVIGVGWLLRQIWPWIPPDYLAFGILGAFAGSLCGLWQAWRAVRRSRSLAQHGQSLGMATAAVDAATLLKSKLAYVLSTADYLHIENVLLRECDGARLEIADLQRVTGGESSQTTWQTVCVLTTDRADLPDFQLEPRGQVTESLSRWGLDGVPFAGIEFDDDPPFSNAYALGGSSESSLRQMFAIEVRQLLSARPWVFFGRGGTCVLFQPNRRVAPGELHGFLQSTQDIFRATTAAVPPAAEHESSDARPVPTLSAPRFHASLEQVDALIDEDAPRQVDLAPWPPIMWVFGALGVAWGTLAAAFGLVFAGAAVYVSQFTPLALLMAPCGLCLTGVVVWLLTYPWRHRKRQRRVLRWGDVTSGQIQSLRGASGSDLPSRTALVSYDVDGQSFTRRFKCFGHSAVLAEQFHEAGREVRVLYDPQRPRHSLIHIALPMYVME